MNATKADAQFLWSCVPKDCKTNLSRLRASGYWEEAKPEVIAAASASLKALGKVCLIDIASALEVEAGRWMERRNQ